MVKNIQSYEEEVLKNSHAVECKLPLNFLNGYEIISVTALSSLSSSEISGGYLSYSGKTIFTVLYKESGEIKKCEHGVEFSYKTEVKRLENGVIGRLFVKTNNEKVVESNGVFTAYATIDVLAVITLEIVTGVNLPTDNLLTKTQNQTGCNFTKIADKTAVIEDEFTLPYSVKDVLFHDERVDIKSVDAGVNLVTVNGEVEVTAYLNRLDVLGSVKERKTIPFTVEIESEYVSPNSVATAEVCVHGANIKALVDENKNKTEFSVEITLSVKSWALETSNYLVVTDAYTISNEVNLIKTPVNLLAFNRAVSENKVENGEVSYELGKNDRLIAVVGVKIESENYLLENGRLIATGVVTATAILEVNGEYKTVEVNSPIELSALLSGNEYKNPALSVCDYSIRLTQSGLAYSFIGKLTALDFTSALQSVITGVELLEKKQINDSAISVYYAQNGETVWDACKVLGVSGEEILKYNENLPEVFTGSERIVIYREF